MGTRYVLHFDNDEFMQSVNKAKWNIYADSLQDLTFFTFSYLKVHFNLKEIYKANDIFLKILDDETTNNMPLDIIKDTKKIFNERFQSITLDKYYKDLSFTSCALSFSKWDPLDEYLKTL